MKNRIIFILGVIFLIIIVWATTMFAIKLKTQYEETVKQRAEQVIIIKKTSKFY